MLAAASYVDPPRRSTLIVGILTFVWLKASPVIAEDERVLDVGVA